MTDRQLLNARKLVIDLHRQQIPVMRIVKEIGLSWPAVKATIKRYEEGGIEALKPRQRGKKEGTGRLLTPEQEIELCNILYRKRPWQVGLRCQNRDRCLHLWNREAVKQLVHDKCGISLSERGLAKYLERWGFPARKQHENQIQRCSRDVQRWLGENYDKLSQRREKEFVEIFWISRKSITVNHPHQDESRRSKKLTMASVIDRSGKEHWLVFRGNFDSEKQISLLKALRTWSRKKPLLIRDKMSNFNGVSQLLADEKIEIFPPLDPSFIKNIPKVEYISDFDPSEFETLYPSFDDDLYDDSLDHDDDF